MFPISCAAGTAHALFLPFGGTRLRWYGLSCAPSSSLNLSVRISRKAFASTQLYSRLEERFAYLERDGAELMLEQPVSQDRLWPRAELAYPFGRGINCQIQVADAERLHAAILAAGVALYLPLEERWYRREIDEIGVRQFTIQDPDGYLLRFSEVIGERR
jgi:hypothetical protein